MSKLKEKRERATVGCGDSVRKILDEEARMRIAAGILLIVLGIFSIGAPTQVLQMIVVATGVPIVITNGVWLALAIIHLVLMVRGGVCALKRRDWRWSLLAAIYCVVINYVVIVSNGWYAIIQGFGSPVLEGLTAYVVAGLCALPVVFLVKRRGEFEF